MFRLFAPDSNDNTLMVTEQCNNHCIMCCQPPKKGNDFDFFEKHNLDIINRSPAGIDVIGITGGEPTLLGARLFTLLRAIRTKYPEALIHLLTNGRLLKAEMVSRLREYDFSRIVFAVPLHSDYSGDHDRITGVADSYNETMRGLYNLAMEQCRVEIRIIINAINYSRLVQLADFVSYNLPFAEDVVFIGMEAVGDAVTNRDAVWIDPSEYRDQLEKAVLRLDGWGIGVGVSNIPLCLLPDSLHRFSWHSISDWKLKFLPECADCDLHGSCGGLFATAKWQSKNIRPIKRAEKDS